MKKRKAEKKRATKPRRLRLTEVQRKLAQFLKGKDVKVVTVKFENDDVPKFLKKLRRFEEESKKVVIIVKFKQ